MRIPYFRQIARRGALWSASLALILGATPSLRGQSPEPTTSAELFQISKIWNVHLTISPSAWKEMEPIGGGFGPSMFLAPVFMAQGDKNHDGKLSSEEFQSLVETWFAKWDKSKQGALASDQLRDGLNDAMAPPPGQETSVVMNLQGQEGMRNGVAGAMGLDFKYVHADLEFEGKRFTDVGVRYKGNGTFMAARNSLKRSFKIDINRYVKGQKFAGLSTLNLHCAVVDGSWMNEVLAHRLFRDSGVPAPRTSYARVFITVPGKYDHKLLGLYSLVENVDKAFLEANFKTREGTIFKPVTPSLYTYMGEDWKSYIRTYDPKGDITPAQQRHIIELSKLITQGTDAEVAAKIGNYIDLDAFGRYMAVMVWLSDLDGILGPGQNHYQFLDPKTNKLKFIAWDQDNSWGQFGMRGTQEDRNELNIMHPWQGDNRFLARIFKVDAFTKRYLGHLKTLSKKTFLPERIGQQVDELGKALRDAVKEESEAKLPRFDQAVAGKMLQPVGFGGFGGAPTQPIKPFSKVRAKSVNEQLAGKSQGRTLGEFSFGPRRGARDGGFSPGNFVAPIMLGALDANKDKQVSREEFVQGFMKLFQLWDSGHEGALSNGRLRAGIDKSFPFPGMQAPPSRD